MQPQFERKSLSIVLRGIFNPAMFHPSWFASQDLIREKEAEAANIEVVHPQVSVFDLDWLRVRITQDRFHVATIQEAYYEPLRDLVMGVFTILDYTPLRVLGINRDFHYDFASEEAWHAIGDLLTPKEHWKDILERPGMRAIVIEGQRPDDLPGYIRVKVEPSQEIRYGIFIDINDHYILSTEGDAIVEKERLLKPLSQNWMESMKRHETIAQSIIKLGDRET